MLANGEPSKFWRRVYRTRVGPNGLADRQAVIDRLQQMAAGEAGYEYRRRKKVAVVLDRLIRERVEQPQLLVSVPLEILSQRLQNLPPGVTLLPGRIVVEFEQPEQALQKLLALAIAAANDIDTFNRAIEKPESQKA